VKFNCDALSDAAKAKRRAERAWHDWFAWRPVKVAHGDCRWLETIERRKEHWFANDYIFSRSYYRAKET
jgi:hypothetical protein